MIGSKPAPITSAPDRIGSCEMFMPAASVPDGGRESFVFAVNMTLFHAGFEHALGAATVIVPGSTEEVPASGVSGMPVHPGYVVVAGAVDAVRSFAVNRMVSVLPGANTVVGVHSIAHERLPAAVDVHELAAQPAGRVTPANAGNTPPEANSWLAVPENTVDE